MKPSIEKSPFRILLATSIVIGLSGCARFDKEKMISRGFRSETYHPYSVSVSIGRGDEEADVGLAPVPRDDLQYAIEESIRTGQVFEEVVSGENGDYMLNVSVFTLEQPVFGINFTVKLGAGWVLTKANGSIVWQKLIKSECSTTMSDSWHGMTRLRMANDGAIRENIKQGMMQLSNLDL